MTGKRDAMKHHCSICHLPGHDARAHRRRPVRRNLDAFWGADGQLHPIRGSQGYSDAFLTVLPASAQRAYESSMNAAYENWDEAEDDWADEVRRAVKAVSRYGIAPHEGAHKLGTEYRLDVPLYLRNRKGLPADQVADLVRREYPHLGIESEDDLLQALDDGARLRQNPQRGRSRGGRTPAAFQRWVAKGMRRLDGKPRAPKQLMHYSARNNTQKEAITMAKRTPARNSKGQFVKRKSAGSKKRRRSKR